MFFKLFKNLRKTTSTRIVTSFLVLWRHLRPFLEFRITFLLSFMYSYSISSENKENISLIYIQRQFYSKIHLFIKINALNSRLSFEKWFIIIIIIIYIHIAWNHFSSNVFGKNLKKWKSKNKSLDKQVKEMPYKESKYLFYLKCCIVFCNISIKC